MYFTRGSTRGEIIKALANLQPGNPKSFISAEIGGKVYDSIQAVRNDDSTFHVELLRKGGNPKIFNGNRIFACEGMTKEAALKLFLAMLNKRDSMPMPKAAKEITTTAAAANKERGAAA